MLGRLEVSEPSLKAELTQAFTHGEHVTSILQHVRHVILRHSTNSNSRYAGSRTALTFLLRQPL